MSLYTRVLNIVMIAIALTCGISCGGKKSKSELVLLTVNPKKPVVITAPTKDSKGQDVEWPWFEFSVTMSNPTTEQITIKALMVKVYAPGQMDPTEVVFTPSQYDFSTDILDCKYSTFGVWSGSESKGFILENGTAGCTGRPQFIIGGLPKSTTNSYRYRVEISPIGWFGPPDAAADRFQKKDTFFTQ